MAGDVAVQLICKHDEPTYKASCKVVTVLQGVWLHYLGVPVTVIDDDSVSSSEGDALPSCPRG